VTLSATTLIYGIDAEGEERGEEKQDRARIA